MFNTILTATDDSEHARKAVAVAGDLAQKYRARLIVLHVIKDFHLSDDMLRLAEAEHLIQPAMPLLPSQATVAADMVIDTGRLRAGAADAYRVLEIYGERIVERARQIAAERGASEVRTLVEGGDPAEQILACAAREKADLIVLGSRGCSDLKGLLMGSVSHKVCQLAACTCISVK
jgi:nucleotide-binding universal stress UspA family protein